MSYVYDGFLTDSNGQYPVKFRYGVPSGGWGYRCYVDGGTYTAWGANLSALGARYSASFQNDPNKQPPSVDNYCTLIVRYPNDLEITSSSFWIGYESVFNVTSSAILLENGVTKIFWFAKTTAQIGLPTTRNIVFSRDSNGRVTATFRVGTTTKFSVRDNVFMLWLAPWIYPDIVYNSSITGMAGGCEISGRKSISDGVTTYSVQIPNSMAVPSYYETTWTSAMQEWLDGVPDPVDTDNPYYNGGLSEPGGGEGNFSEDSDDVEEDEIPSIDAVGTGMATIFSPTKSQLKSLSEVFWGTNWWQALQNTIEGIDKMFVSLGIVPFNVTKGSTVEVTWLGLSITEVTLTLASKQFYEFDMGTIDLSDDSRIFSSGSALDYSPFSRLGIYLPFIGFQDLDIDECRGTTINLKYRIDILSGTCVALIKIGGKTIYQFTGNCITQIPITSQNFENMFTNAVNVGIALGTARNAAAVASAGEAVSSEMVQQGKMSATAAALDATQRSARVSAANASLGNATANAMMGMKPDFNKTGSVSASASLLTVKQPFLYLKTPRQCLPDHYQRYCGFPSNITGKLSEFSGYTVVEDIRLNGLVATNGEVEEIYDLLKSGVIV